MRLYKMRTLKFGTLMGVDKLGNEYYENLVEYPHGAWPLGRAEERQADFFMTLLQLLRRRRRMPCRQKKGGLVVVA